NPTGSDQTFARRYWVIHQYGSGTFASDITFTLREELGPKDQHNPTRIILDSRGCMADTSWGFSATAANADAGTDQVAFPGISEFGQFITGKGKIIYVKSNASGINNGSSWNNAFTSLQPALDDAVAGNQIWVSSGKYLPSSIYDIPAPTNRSKHFRMKNNLGIFGGFAGIEADTFDLSERDLVTNETILSGDMNNNGRDDFDCYHVFYHPSGLELTHTSILDGFSVTGGNANGNDPFASGGGLYNISTSPSIRNCIFKDNWGLNGGGVGNAVSSSPELVNCLVVSDTAVNGGGGVYNSSGSCPVFINCTMTANSAQTGGGVFTSGSGAPVLNNCIIWGNSATGTGMSGKQFAIDQGTVTLNYSCYSDTTGDIYLTNGGNLIASNQNITDDPLLVRAANDDFRIFGDSPCVNTGSNGFDPEPIDVRGETRIQGGIIDRGAYEWTNGIDPASHVFTWTGAVSNDWNTPGNWTSGAVPGQTDDVYIPDVANDPVINQSSSEPATCNNLTIKSTTVLTILQEKALIVYGDLTITQ
ncbi:MAG: right-handed parallel beta-helix repeat-containing protein, partial [Bacteroidetes bacterium]|nr:right-handed parallel beta-helix repeat-containing protein [Bacteroidota bacterium]